MNFDFSEEQEGLRATARRFLEEQSPLSVCRAVLESDGALSRDLWKNAAGLGWLGAVVPERHGGAGMGYLELAVLAEEVGRALAPVPFAGSVYLAAEALLSAGSADQKRRFLPRLAAGEIIGTLALDEAQGNPGVDGPETLFEDGAISGGKVPVLDGAAADFAVVSVRARGGASLAIVELDAGGVEVAPLSSFDPSRPLARYAFRGAAAELLGAEGSGPAVVGRLLDRAAVLMAFEQLGAAGRAFEMTREYALKRYAFGRPIASYQALKHRLADAWSQIELARSNAYYGAWALSTGDPELGIAACVARIAASDAFCHMAEEMLQMHGGIGYTWEHDCHLFYRRARLLAAALGNASRWKHRLIDRLRASVG